MGGRITVTGYLLLGIGLGALVDGVLLHQVLQWHHLWSARRDDGSLAGLEWQTTADGLLHAAAIVLIGVGLALVAGRPARPGAAAGLVLIGWGAFNAVDQLVFHLALGAHHIRMDTDHRALYDWSFFGVGIVLAAVGSVIARPWERRVPGGA